MIHWQDDTVTLHHGDALEVARTLPDGAADCIVTSPPYFGLRDYGSEGQYGLEETPEEYTETMRALFHELRRVLAKDGTLWLNIGDSYAGSGKGAWANKEVQKEVYVPDPGSVTVFRGLPAKNMLMIPARVALALQADGWILRNDIVWAKPNGMPDSVRDRFACKYEHVFLFSKSKKYWFDLDPLREPMLYPDNEAKQSWDRQGAKEELLPGRTSDLAIQHRSRKDITWADRKAAGEPMRKGLDGQYGGDRGYHPNGKNPGDVWSIPTEPFPGAHFAVFPKELARRCIVAGCKPGGTVLDPFNGSGTTGHVAQNNGRKYIGIDISADYLNLTLDTRLQNAALDLGGI